MSPGVTSHDLYVEGLNFVFGLADNPGKAALISLYRLHAGGEEPLFRARAVKEAVHELDIHVALGTVRTVYASWHSAIR